MNRIGKGFFWGGWGGRAGWSFSCRFKQHFAKKIA